MKQQGSCANQVDEAFLFVPPLVLGIGAQVAGGSRAERGQGGPACSFCNHCLGLSRGERLLAAAGVTLVIGAERAG